MIITKELIENCGNRSPMIRSAMVRAGDKIRIVALKKALLSIGSCVLTFEDVGRNGYLVQEKKFSFSLTPLIYVLLAPDDFVKYPSITSPIALEVAHIRNGLIGIRRKKAVPTNERI